MYAMNIQNDLIGLVLRENCKSKQMTNIIAWPSRCHGRIYLLKNARKENSIKNPILPLDSLVTSATLIKCFKHCKNH